MKLPNNKPESWLEQMFLEKDGATSERNFMMNKRLNFAFRYINATSFEVQSAARNFTNGSKNRIFPQHQIDLTCETNGITNPLALCHLLFLLRILVLG